MSEDGHARLRRLAYVVAAADAGDPAQGICRACVDVLGVAGASLVVVTEGLASPLGWSNALAARLEELQQTLGEGPSVDAHESGRSVGEPDLGHPRSPRWFGFAPAAVEAGARALFSFPLRLGAVRLGALTIHRTTPGELSPRQHADAQAVAEVAVNAILTTQAGAPGGGLSPDLEALAGYSAALHQAAGMVSVQLDVGVGEAIVLLRAHAYINDRQLGDVAADVVARRLRLDE